MKTILTVTLYIFILIRSVSAGDVNIHVDQNTVSKGSSIQVTLTAKGDKILFPTIQSIGPYPVDTPKISKKIEASYVNGTFKSIRQETMRFTFSPEKNITIPSMEVQVDGEIKKTSPIPITVLSTNKQLADKDGYRLEMLISRQHVYLGEAFPVQVIFFEPRNSNVAQAQYIAPKFDGFFVKASQERLENIPEGTKHIFDYILTPQKEGNITITAPVIKLGIQTFSGTRDPWGFFSNEVHWRSLQGTPKTIQVQPLPVHADLVGNFTIRGIADTTRAEVNKPVNYTLVIEGEGNLDDIDAPKIDIPGVTVYSDDGQSVTQLQGNHILSRWEKKYTFIADHDFTIPKISLKTFDPNTTRTANLSTQPIVITITGNTANPSSGKGGIISKTPLNTSTISPSNGEEKSKKTDSNRSLFEDTAFYNQLAKENRWREWPWWSLLVSFSAGFFLALLGVWLRSRFAFRRSRSSLRKYSIAEALELLYPHTHDSPEIEKMVRHLYRIQNGETDLTVDKNELHRLIQSLPEK